MMDTSDVEKKRPTRKNLNLCRICLTHSPSVKNLNDNFDKDPANLSIREVLKRVLSSEILVTRQTPSDICSICLSFLKISYDFKKQFEETQKKLFGNLNIPINQKRIKTSKEVELIVGDKNFSLDDVVILDDDKKIEDVSELLNRIGKSVTVECKKNIEPDEVLDDANAGGITHNNSNDDEDLEDSNAGGITNNNSNVDEEYETIIIEYVSDSEGLLDNQVENIECGEELSEPIGEAFSNRQHENLRTGSNTVKPRKKTRTKRSTRAAREEMREIEKYIICEGDIPENKFDKKGCSTTYKNDYAESCASKGSAEKNGTECLLVENIQRNSGSLDASNMREILKYSCKECPVSFNNERSLESHMTYVHGNQNSAEEKEKEEIFKEKMLKLREERRLRLKEQQRKKVQNWREKFKRNPMLCQICGHVSLSPGGARYHSLTHGERRFKCSKCPMKFLTLSALKNHLSYVHEKNIVKHLCTLCGEYRNSSGALKYHMKIHNNEPRKYSCHICGMSFLVEGVLRTHLRRHMGDRRYSCSFCEKTFYTNNETKKHMMIHTGERPFKCKYCEKRFATPFNRKVHMMTHSGPNLCKICFKGLADEDLLKMHIQYKHCPEQKRPARTISEPIKTEAEGTISELIKTEAEVGIMDSPESVKVEGIKNEDFEFPQHSPKTSSDFVILEVLNMLDAPE